MFFEDFSTLRAFTEPKVAPYARVVDNTLLGHVFMFPARAWHAIVVPVGLTSWSGQLPPQLHVSLGQILC